MYLTYFDKHDNLFSPVVDILSSFVKEPFKY